REQIIFSQSSGGDAKSDFAVARFSLTNRPRRRSGLVVLIVLIARAAAARACYFMCMSASFSNPRENVLQLGLHEGMKVGDFGAGSGHYARAAAAAVGTSGRVYAIDVQEDVLKHLKLNTHAHHQSTIDSVWGDIEKLGG